ncbi:hypothetical protein GCM10010503_07250 [Streptomyces lucensis JCM 4490]|uniref:Uncharacterized protein n=1 Tax=Streptomyces lucensis JCM 4490 TaxID=1306176 RepID=A0A918IVE6_9ACTN|nr:hypothetical protein GCM10010503_07250 [Streptomyces lucensis JCM 4490]
MVPAFVMPGTYPNAASASETTRAAGVCGRGARGMRRAELAERGLTECGAYEVVGWRGWRGWRG